MGTNCYLAVDEATQKCLIIDPGDEGDFITTSILENKLSSVGILLTHGHYDHCLAALELKLNFNIPIYLHQKDLFLYKKAHISASYWSTISLVKGRSGVAERDLNFHLPPIDIFLTDKQNIPFGDSSLMVLHTPGHTPGSCCFYISPVKGRSGEAERDSSHLFTGDTLFATGSGKADRSYSSLPALRKSISGIKKDFPDALIYPGHEDFGVFIRR